MQRNVFELASERKYRFAGNGVWTVEDLWTIKESVLETIYKNLKNQEKELGEHSLFAASSETSERQDILNMVAIIEHIASVRKERAAAKLREKVEKEARNTEKKLIQEALMNKKFKNFESLSEEELLARLQTMS